MTLLTRYNCIALGHFVTLETPLPCNLKGLSAARELTSNGLDVLVLEARDRVGGRTLTKQAGPSSGQPGEAPFWVDLGGSYVGPTQDNVLNLIDELKLKTYLVEDTLDIGYLRARKAAEASGASGGPSAWRPWSWWRCKGARLSQSSCPAGADETNSDEVTEYTSRFHPSQDVKFGANIFYWLDYVGLVRKIDKMGAQIEIEAPWLAPKAREWDSMTFRQFINESAWTLPVKNYFNNIFLPIDVCAEAEEVSLLWFLWYVKQCGGVGRTIATTNGGQERKIHQGTQQISQRLADLITQPGNGAKVLLGKPVCMVNQSNRATIQVTCLDGSQFECDHLILAIPPHLWLKIHFEPALPPVKNQLAQRMSMGNVAKVILYYDKAFWKEHKYSGCFLIDSKLRRKHPIILSLDETKPDGSNPAIIGFCGARGWYEMRDKSNIDVANIVASSYAQVTGLNEFREFKKVERFDWCKEQYSGGCYPGIMGPNTMTKFGRHIREPFGRIYFAGTETAIKWSGYMDGAISAGKRAAREVLFASGKLDSEQSIWATDPARPDAKPFEYPASHDRAPRIECLIRSVAFIGFISFTAVSGIVLVKTLNNIGNVNRAAGW